MSHLGLLGREDVDVVLGSCATNHVKPNTDGSLAYDWELPEGL